MELKSRRLDARHWHKQHTQLGMTYDQIAKANGVTKNIVAGAIWRHVKKTGYDKEKVVRNVSNKLKGYTLSNVFWRYT